MNKAGPFFSVLIVCSGVAQAECLVTNCLSADYQKADPASFEVLTALIGGCDCHHDAVGVAGRASFVLPPGTTSEDALKKLVKKAKGDYLLLLSSPRLILSPGVIRHCRQAISIQKRCVVCFNEFTLNGGGNARLANVEAETIRSTERLLAELDFPKKPYALFRQSEWSKTSGSDILAPASEAACWMIPRELWAALSQSGSCADIYQRALHQEGYRIFMILGEGCFNPSAQPRTVPFDEDVLLSGAKEGAGSEQKTSRFPRLKKEVVYLGHIPQPFRRLLQVAVESRPSRELSPHLALVHKNLDLALGVADPAVPDASPVEPILLILGMHRSMTSYISRKLLEATRGTIPGTPVPGAVRSNPEGHFEPHEVVVLHDRFFKDLGLSWKSPTLLGYSGASEEQTLQNHKRQLRKLLAWGLRGIAESNPGQLAVIKDPRLARFWPLWESVLASEKLSHKKIILVDHPEKVAQSLHRRDGMNKSWAKLLWARYTLDCLSARRSGDCVIAVHQMRQEQLESILSTHCGVPIRLNDYRPASPTDSGDLLTKIYETFQDDQNLERFRLDLMTELSWVDRHAELFGEEPSA